MLTYFQVGIIKKFGLSRLFFFSILYWLMGELKKYIFESCTNLCFQPIRNNCSFSLLNKHLLIINICSFIILIKLLFIIWISINCVLNGFLYIYISRYHLEENVFFFFSVFCNSFPCHISYLALIESDILHIAELLYWFIYFWIEISLWNLRLLDIWTIDHN